MRFRSKNVVARNLGPGTDRKDRFGAGGQRWKGLEKHLARPQAVRPDLGARRLDATRKVGEQLVALGFLRAPVEHEIIGGRLLAHGDRPFGVFHIHREIRHSVDPRDGPGRRGQIVVGSGINLDAAHAGDA